MADEEYKRLGCTVTGCGGNHKGLGLCQMHYRRLKRTGSAETITRQCARCGEQFANQRTTAMYCTKACKLAAWVDANKDRFKQLNAESAARQRAKTAPARAASKEARKLELAQARLLAQKASAQARKEMLSLVHGSVPCRMCGKPCGYAGNGPPRRYCSHECARSSPEAVASKRVSRTKRKAMERGASGGSVDPIKVFDRDGWRCQLCKCKTPKAKRGSYDADAPELDHIIPLSKGGDHSYLNTQCACRACNAAKSNKPMGQMLLIG